jgi:hypothetical protein
MWSISLRCQLQGMQEATRLPIRSLPPLLIGSRWSAEAMKAILTLPPSLRYLTM